MNVCLDKLKRRTFLTLSTGGLVGCAIVHSPKELADPWKKAAKILQQTKVPQFPSRIFSVVDFGAKAEKNFKNTQAFAAAIDACHQHGGGRVVVPAGEYLTGPIHLLSNVNFHLEEGTKLIFSTDTKDYLPAVYTRWEGMEMMSYSPLIYAYKQTNIALTGKGQLDGQADKDNWWPWAGGKKWAKAGVETVQPARKQLALDAEANRPVEERVYAEGAQFRPAFVQFHSCDTCLIENVTITRAPFWLIHPVMSQNITVRGVTCASLGPNSDGCDPESCKNVVIENCVFDTGDDCIAIKSGRNADGRRINTPSENIVIRGCKMHHGHGGVVIGSEISGGARNIFAENCEMDSEDLERGLRLKTNSVRGGTIENIYLRNIKIGKVQTAIVVDLSYDEGDSGTFTPTIRNVEVRNLQCDYAKQIFNVIGYERAPIQNLRLIDVNFDEASDVGMIKNMEGFTTKNVTIRGKPFSL